MGQGTEHRGQAGRNPPGGRGFWHRLRGGALRTKSPGPVRLRVHYLGGDTQVPAGPAQLEVWPAYGAAILWAGRRHLVFSLSTVQRVGLHEFLRRRRGPVESAVGVACQQGPFSRTLWFSAPRGGGEGVYLELLLLLRRPAQGRPGGMAAPPQKPR